jgi:hypothetical protein
MSIVAIIQVHQTLRRTIEVPARNCTRRGWLPSMPRSMQCKWITIAATAPGQRATIECPVIAAALPSIAALSRRATHSHRSIQELLALIYVPTNFILRGAHQRKSGIQPVSAGRFLDSGFTAARCPGMTAKRKASAHIGRRKAAPHRTPAPTASCTELKPSARSFAASSRLMRPTSPGPWNTSAE